MKHASQIRYIYSELFDDALESYTIIDADDSVVHNCISKLNIISAPQQLGIFARQDK